MKRILTGIAAVGALAAGLAIAQTTAAPQAGAARGRGVRARMIKALNLTDTQRQQAKTILQSAKQTAQPLAQQLKQDRAALTAAVEAGDSAKIQQLSTEIGSLRGNVLGVRSQAMAKFYALLTPDQKTKAEEFLQKAQEVLGNGNGE
ncbi:MAG: Spy/CpxP family protein refolding chaperone [Bryobacteraceae bacterium]|jgi:Spy/CpxP family protein refolding chaperone